MAEHEWIGAAVHLQVLYAYVVATPEYLVGIVHRHVLQFEMAHLAKHLRRVDNRVAHLQMVAIPQGRTSADSEVAVFYFKPMNMPERIVTLETAVRSLYITTFLYCRLSFGNQHIVYV